jgi:hypothetical protein
LVDPEDEHAASRTTPAASAAAATWRRLTGTRWRRLIGWSIPDLHVESYDR